MNKQDYRAQVDAVSFSPDFQGRTMARLMALAQEKEKKTVRKLSFKTGLVAAAVAAVLLVSVYAATVLLRPQDVARQAGNEALAAAFESGQAVTVNETKTVGDYDVTLMGMVSGEDLSGVEALENSVLRDKTYAVLAYARTDGTAINDNVPELTVTPLVKGYAPWMVNAWTLHGGTFTFAQDGTFYYLFECDSVEPFADHTVYLAVYPGTHAVPSAARFDFDEATGAIGAKGEASMFVLPLDRSKADPQKVQAILDEIFGPKSVENTEPVDGLPADADETFTISEDPDHPEEFILIKN